MDADALQKMIAEQLAKLEENKNTPKGYTVKVGMTYALLLWSIQNRKERALSASIKGNYVESQAPLKTKEAEHDMDKSKDLLHRFDAKYREDGARLPMSVRLSFNMIADMVSEMANDETPMNYAVFEFQVLGPIEGRMVTTEEGRKIPVFRLGEVMGVSKPTRANNPFADSSKEATVSELEEAISADAQKARQGYDNGRKGVVDTATSAADDALDQEEDNDPLDELENETANSL